MRATFSDVENIAAEKVGVEGWGAWEVRSVDGGYVARGCVPNGHYTRGRRKGQPRWKRPVEGTSRTVVVSHSDVEQARTAYEAQGKCWDCKGTGQVFAGWSAAEGIKERACSRCGGTGVASRLTPAEGDGV